MRPKLSGINARLRHVYEVFLRHAWSLVWVGIFGVLGGVLTWRDELLPEDFKQQLRLLKVLPHWSWGWWAVAVFGAAFLIVIEGSFSVRRRFERENGALASKLDTLASDRCLVFNQVQLSLLADRHVDDGLIIRLHSVALVIDNNSEFLLRYTMDSIAVSYEGTEAKMQPFENNGGLIHKGKPATFYTGAFKEAILLRSLPAQIFISFDTTYDSVPSLRRRTFGKSLRVDLASLTTNFVTIFVEEREG